MIVIPMLGRSSRFFRAGYSLPKYELPIGGETVFDYVIRSFEPYFETDEFFFGVREDFHAYEFVSQKLKERGISEFQIFEFDRETEGQASSVWEILKLSEVLSEKPEAELLVFNADTFLTRFQIEPPELAGDGYLEVFRGEGDHWSFVKPTGDGNRVLRTAEKLRISDLCSNGLYYFRSVEIYGRGYEELVRTDDRTNGEFYIAPMYNHLIRLGMDIRYKLVQEDDSVFCGTPAEYEHLVDGLDAL